MADGYDENQVSEDNLYWINLAINGGESHGHGADASCCTLETIKIMAQNPTIAEWLARLIAVKETAENISDPMTGTTRVTVESIKNNGLELDQHEFFKGIPEGLFEEGKLVIEMNLAERLLADADLGKFEETLSEIIISRDYLIE